MEKAIAAYIDGDMPRAELLFIEVTQQQSSPEDLQTAYLYLGRIYMARGDYDLAAEAFSAGSLLGGDVRFEEYFERAKLRSGVSVVRVATQATVTRAQLAALIQAMFGGALGSGDATVETSPGDPIGSDGSSADTAGRGDVKAIAATGVMRVLPDGEFHADARMTGPAFYMVLVRLAARLGVDASVVEAMYPGGYRGALTGPDAEQPFVTGREVVDCLEGINNAAGL